ncbi:MAG: thermonuclease family protein [Candidatus Omnitrophota bacterium]
MKNKLVYILAVVFVAILFSIGRFLQHTPIAPKDYNRAFYVSRVIDGDTIELSNGEILRYIGVNTPELRERIGVNWVYNPMPYAELARDFNQDLTEGKSIRLEFDVQKRDRYNRLLAYVYIGDKMVNLELVRQGYSMIYTYPPNVKHIEKFLKAQGQAREEEKGLWSGLEKDVILSSNARENIGSVKMVQTDVLSTFLSERLLILNCRDNFKVAIFKNNLAYFPKELLRSPDTYLRYKAIRVYGVIKDYKGSSEIIVYHPSQLEILE